MTFYRYIKWLVPGRQQIDSQLSGEWQTQIILVKETHKKLENYESREVGVQKTKNITPKQRQLNICPKKKHGVFSVEIKNNNPWNNGTLANKRSRRIEVIVEQLQLVDEKNNKQNETED